MPPRRSGSARYGEPGEEGGGRERGGPAQPQCGPGRPRCSRCRRCSVPRGGPAAARVRRAPPSRDSGWRGARCGRPRPAPSPAGPRRRAGLGPGRPGAGGRLLGGGRCRRHADPHRRSTAARGTRPPGSPAASRSCSTSGVRPAALAPGPLTEQRRLRSAPGRSGTSPAAGRAAHCLDQPEILQAGARCEEAEGVGLLLVLSVLAQANVSGSVAWADWDRCVMANTSESLLAGAARYPALANHSLRVHLGGTGSNFSVSAANSVGVTTASLLLAGLLDARVELPLLGVGVGAALALGALLSLGSCAACLAWRRAKPVPGTERAGGSSPLHRCSRCSGSEHPRPRGACLPRQTRSLPPDLRLADLVQEAGASPEDTGASAGGEESARPGPENSLVICKHGFVQLLTSGRIYKVPSVSSSDEIWL